MPSTALEQRIKDGYAAFIAARVSIPGDWAPGSALGQALHDDVVWYDDDLNRAQGNAMPTAQGKPAVLQHLRRLKREIGSLQLLFVQEAAGYVHTLDRSEVVGRGARRSGVTPHLCGDIFEFDQNGLITEVHYCAFELPLP